MVNEMAKLTKSQVLFDLDDLGLDIDFDDVAYLADALHDEITDDSTVRVSNREYMQANNPVYAMLNRPYGIVTGFKLLYACQRDDFGLIDELKAEIL